MEDKGFVQGRALGNTIAHHCSRKAWGQEPLQAAAVEIRLWVMLLRLEVELAYNPQVRL